MGGGAMDQYLHTIFINSRVHCVVFSEIRDKHEDRFEINSQES